MNDFPPLPHFLTLDEAAQAVADRTGKPWTARQILGCAERHEITVFARIDRAAEFVRVQPTDGRTNKIAADAGSLPILGAKAVQALLLTGNANSTGWEEPGTVDFFGEPVRAWARAFELAQGEEPPRVTMGDCRVTAHGVLELVALYTAEPDEPQEAPQAAAPEQEAPKGPLALTTGDIAFCFDGLRWNEKQWRKPLGYPPKWLQSCIVIPGQRGVREATWNPVSIAGRLVKDGYVKARSARARFQTKPQLAPWLEVWKTYEADYLDND